MRKKVELKNGAKVLIRNLRGDDVDRSLAFFRALPADERLYLRNDVTRRKVVTERINLMKTGRIKRLVALADDRIVADGSLETEGYTWKNHVAELRLIVAPEFQRQALGMILARELFLIATRKRVEEVIAKVMRPQQAALKIVRKLGFHEDAVLPDYVKDTKGAKHDLIIMRCKLQDLLGELEHYFAMSDWQRTR